MLVPRRQVLPGNRRKVDAAEAVRLLEGTGDQWEVNTARWHIAFALYRMGDLPAAIDPLRREIPWVSRSPMREHAQSGEWRRGGGGTRSLAEDGSAHGGAGERGRRSGGADGVQAEERRSRLYDSNQIQLRQDHLRHVGYTSIHEGHYSTIDHVLVSEEFNRASPRAIGEVIERHMIGIGFLPEQKSHGDNLKESARQRVNAPPVGGTARWSVDAKLFRGEGLVASLFHFSTRRAQYRRTARKKPAAQGHSCRRWNPTRRSQQVRM